MFKKFGRRLALGLLSLLLISFLIISAMLTTVRPENIKNWLSKSGVYAAAPDVVVNNLTKNQSTDSGDNFSFSDVLAQRAVKKALSVNFLQNSTNQIVDGTFHWLDGETPQPDFSVDVSAAKQTFIDELANAIRARYVALPVCGARQIPASTEPLAIDCQVRGYNIEQVVADFKTKMASNKDFLPNAQLTADNLTNSDATSTNKPTLNYSQEIPKRYQQIQLARWISLGVIVALGIAVIYLSDTKLAGLKRLGISLIVAGVLCLLGLWITYITVNSLKGRIPVSLTEQNMRDALLKLTDLARHDLTIEAGKTATIYMVLGMSFVTGVFFKTRDKKPKDKEQPKPPAPQATPPVDMPPQAVSPSK